MSKLIDNPDVILLGAGSRRDRRIAIGDRLPQTPDQWKDQTVVSVDMDDSHNPDVVWDLNNLPWPFPDNIASEIHAYEVLEHIGTQGDFKTFFTHFYEIWRILKPGGVLVATVPHWTSLWAFGDPGHSRVINLGSLTFLDQNEYKKQVGKTSLADYRKWWAGDLKTLGHQDVPESGNPTNFLFVLEAVKPARLEER